MAKIEGKGFTNNEAIDKRSDINQPPMQIYRSRKATKA
jgi:hypothetical protein